MIIEAMYTDWIDVRDVSLNDAVKGLGYALRFGCDRAASLLARYICLSVTYANAIDLANRVTEVMIFQETPSKLVKTLLHSIFNFVKSFEKRFKKLEMFDKMSPAVSAAYQEYKSKNPAKKVKSKV